MSEHSWRTMHDLRVRVAVYLTVQEGATIEQAACVLGMTRERVRQLLAQAGEIHHGAMPQKYELMPTPAYQAQLNEQAAAKAAEASDA